jgi:hypothetical protein
LKHFFNALKIAGKFTTDNRSSVSDRLVEALRGGQFTSDEDIKRIVGRYNELGYKTKFWLASLGDHGCGVKIINGRANVVNINLAEPAETFQTIAESSTIRPELTVISSELLAGIVPIIVTCFAGNLFPSYVIGVGYSPTIVCNRDKDGRRVFNEGQRVLIYLSDSTELTFKKFCAFFNDFFSQQHPTVFGLDYLQHLFLKYRPKFC